MTNHGLLLYDNRNLYVIPGTGGEGPCFNTTVYLYPPKKIWDWWWNWYRATIWGVKLWHEGPLEVMRVKLYKKNAQWTYIEIWVGGECIYPDNNGEIVLHKNQTVSLTIEGWVPAGCQGYLCAYSTLNPKGPHSCIWIY